REARAGEEHVALLEGESHGVLEGEPIPGRLRVVAALDAHVPAGLRPAGELAAARAARAREPEGRLLGAANEVQPTVALPVGSPLPAPDDRRPRLPRREQRPRERDLRGPLEGEALPLLHRQRPATLVEEGSKIDDASWTLHGGKDLPAG